MEIQNLLSSPAYSETLARFRNKAGENAKQAFTDLISADKEQLTRTDSPLHENITHDNGVKSAVMMGRLSSQEAQDAGAMTVIKLTEEEKLQWKGENLPEGIRFCNAGGVMFTGGTKTFDTQTGVFYTSGDDYDYQFAALYDENSPEDNPVIYLQMSAVTTNSPHYKDFIDCNEIVKVEVNKVDPANASY